MTLRYARMLRSICVCLSLTAVGSLAQPALGDGRSPELTSQPAPPRITYPHGPLKGLSTSIAWMGDVHEAYEVRITRENSPGSATVWESGEIAGQKSHVTTPVLPGKLRLWAFVRLRNAVGWSDWSSGVPVETPASPQVRVLSPADAGRARAPETAVEWQVETNSEVRSQQIAVDGGASIELEPGERSYRISGLTEGVHRVELRVSDESGDSVDAAALYVYRPVQAAPAELFTLDLSVLGNVNVAKPDQAADAFGTLHLVGVLQGIVNRERPRLYVNYTTVDSFWLDRIREPGGYLEHSSLTPLVTIEDAVRKFRDEIEGAVVWDPKLPCTSNIASTICGCENLLPMMFDERPDSLYGRLVLGGSRLNVVHNLVGMFSGEGKLPGTDINSTGSAKCDAYLWAKMNYIDSGKCDPTEIGYYCDAFWLNAPQDMSLDNVGLTNHDFLVARRGFICDLDVWPDEAPRDDPNQRAGLDRETLLQILQSCHDKAAGKMIHFCGFTPWAMKYTNVGNAGGKHDAVPTEWETAQLASAYNCFVDADAIGYVGMANASVYSHCELPDRLVQNPPPTRDELEAKGYLDADGNLAPLNFVYHYLGDYDSAAWMYHRLPELWQNPVRGKIASGWAFNPNLVERLPVAFDWVYRTKSPVDYFIAGDSGAGYTNPTQLLPPREPSANPSGAQAWVKHNTPYYRTLNYSITGFLINGFCGRLTRESNEIYLPFSGDGIMTQLHWMPEDAKHDHMLSGMPVAGMKQDITAPVDVVVEAILKHGRPDQTTFLSFRSILVGPDWIQTVNDRIRSERPDCRFEPVDPYTYFYLLRHSLGGRNECRATYTFDTMPARVNAGQNVRVTVGLRNDGWDNWCASGSDAVVLHASFGSRVDGVDVPLPTDVEPGEGTAVTFDLTAPGAPGRYDFRLDLRRGIDGYFGDEGDMPWQRTVAVGQEAGKETR